MKSVLKYFHSNEYWVIPQQFTYFCALMLNLIDKDKLPRHIAIIMDGNGRWAQERNQDRLFGHQQGTKSVKEIVEACVELGIEFLTLYAFSTENWNRPQQEINGLMELLVSTLRREIEEMSKNNIRLKVIGDRTTLPEICIKELNEAESLTAHNEGLTLILALSYSSKWEMIEAVKNISAKVAKGEILLQDINDDTIKNHLSTAQIPDPEFMIRTSGEHRISNFLLYQLAYSELYFTNTHWPDFRKENLFEAILNYQNRERRFGKTSEQLSTL